MNHLLELMELYPLQFQKQLNLSSNPNLTIEYVINHPYVDWDRWNLLINPSISTPSNFANPNYQNISWMSIEKALGSSSFSEKEVLEHIHYLYDNDKKLNINAINRVLHNNGNITLNFFKAINQSWTDYWVYLGRNEHFVVKLCNYLAKFPQCISECEAYFRKDFFNNPKLTLSLWTSLCKHYDVRYMVNKYYDDFRYMAYNPNVSETELKKSKFCNSEWYDVNVNCTIATIYQNYQKEELLNMVKSTNLNLFI